MGFVVRVLTKSGRVKTYIVVVYQSNMAKQTSLFVVFFTTVLVLVSALPQPSKLTDGLDQLIIHPISNDDKKQLDALSNFFVEQEDYHGEPIKAKQDETNDIPSAGRLDETDGTPKADEQAELTPEITPSKDDETEVKKIIKEQNIVTELDLNDVPDLGQEDMAEQKEKYETARQRKKHIEFLKKKIKAAKGHAFSLNSVFAEEAMNAIYVKKAENALNAKEAWNAAQAKESENAYQAKEAENAGAAKEAINATLAIKAENAMYAMKAINVGKIISKLPPTPAPPTAAPVNKGEHLGTAPTGMPKITAKVKFAVVKAKKAFNAVYATKSKNALFAQEAKNAAQAKESHNAWQAKEAENAKQAGEAVRAYKAKEATNAKFAKYAVNAMFALEKVDSIPE